MNGLFSTGYNTDNVVKMIVCHAYISRMSSLFLEEWFYDFFCVGKTELALYDVVLFSIPSHLRYVTYYFKGNQCILGTCFIANITYQLHALKIESTEF